MTNKSIISPTTSNIPRIGYYAGASNIINPLSLNPILRFRAGFGVNITGNKVDSWTDEIQGIVVSQPTVASRPSVGYDSFRNIPYVKFSSQYLKYSGQIDSLESRQGITIFMYSAAAIPGSVGNVQLGAGIFSYQLFNLLSTKCVGMSGNITTEYVSTYINNGSTLSVNNNNIGGNWCLRSLIHDGSKVSAAARLKAYSNGYLKSTGSGVLKTFSNGSQPELTIGAYSQSGYTTLDGAITEILVFNRALSSTEHTDVVEYFFDTYVNSKKLIVCDGNSLTSGTGGTQPNTYPDILEKLLGNSFIVCNAGVGGQTTPQMTTLATSKVDNEYGGIRWNNPILVAWECTNDSYFGADATTTYNNYVTYCQARRTAGFKVIACTYLSRSGGTTPGTFNADRATVNGNIVANWATFADGLADLAANSNIGPDGAESNATYFAGDSTHLNSTGYSIVANIILPVVRSLLS